MITITSIVLFAVVPHPLQSFVFLIVNAA